MDELDLLLLEAAASAMAPANMVPSSSAPAPAAARGSPPFEDKLVLSDSVLPSASSPPAAVLNLSPSPQLFLPPAPASVAAASVSRGVGTTTDASFSSSEEEYASGDLDSSSSDGFSWQEGRARHAEAWVSSGHPELCEHMLYAFIEPPVHPDDVSAAIRAALLQVALLVPVDLLPSSHGAMLLRAASVESRDELRRLSPIAGDGFSISLQRQDETANRFFRVLTWLAFVAVVDFPLEHWYEEKIKDCFRAFSELAEIDPECLTGEHFGTLRLLLEVNDRLELPFELRISARCGVGRDGAVAKILPIKIWPREYQLDSRGRLASFFGPPAPPSAGPSLGPPGPFNRGQQRRPQPNYYSSMYPPLPRHDAPQHGRNRSLLFDPLATLNKATVAVNRRLRFPASCLGVAVLSISLLARASSSSATGGSAPASPRTACVADAREIIPAAASAAKFARPPITYRRRCRVVLPAPAPCRRRGQPKPKPSAPTRASSRLAAKAPTHFIDMTAQAIQQKALLNSLSSCSKELKRHVSKWDILSRNCLPLNSSELRKLITAAKLDTVDVGPVVVAHGNNA